VSVDHVWLTGHLWKSEYTVYAGRVIDVVSRHSTQVSYWLLAEGVTFFHVYLWLEAGGFNPDSDIRPLIARS
jgi:hypothetical protein